jgi:hypothetical protein
MFDALGPVTDGLKTYREANGGLPETLAEAFPQGVPSGVVGEDLAASPKSYVIVINHENRQFHFDGSSDDYTISFHYSGPGMNNCRWSVIDDDWACKGML